ncbi:MAG: hypothetical protein WBB45_19730 [Cyclobacteriaceae bacterium]
MRGSFIFTLIISSIVLCGCNQSGYEEKPEQKNSTPVNESHTIPDIVRAYQNLAAKYSLPEILYIEKWGEYVALSDLSPDPSEVADYQTFLSESMTTLKLDSSGKHMEVMAESTGGGSISIKIHDMENQYGTFFSLIEEAYDPMSDASYIDFLSKGSEGYDVQPIWHGLEIHALFFPKDTDLSLLEAHPYINSPTYEYDQDEKKLTIKLEPLVKLDCEKGISNAQLSADEVIALCDIMKKQLRNQVVLQLDQMQ